jgi:hypothetical protein
LNDLIKEGVLKETIIELLMCYHSSMFEKNKKVVTNMKKNPYSSLFGDENILSNLVFNIDKKIEYNLFSSLVEVKKVLNNPINKQLEEVHNDK